MNVNYDAQKESRWRFRFVERREILVIGDILAEALALITAFVVWGNQTNPLGFSIKFIINRVPGWFYVLPLIWLVSGEYNHCNG